MMQKPVSLGSVGSRPNARTRRLHSRRLSVNTHSDHITATLETPLGIMLAEDKQNGRVIIESITSGSNADKLQLFQANDILVSCSAIMMKTDANSMYTDRRRKQGCCSTGCSDCPFNLKNWARVEFDCRDKSFQTVIAALQSNTAPFSRALAHSGGRKITITVERPR